MEEGLGSGVAFGGLEFKHGVEVCIKTGMSGSSATGQGRTVSNFEHGGVDGENALVIELVAHFHVGILEVEVELCIADFVHDSLEIDAIRSLGLQE